MKKRALFHLLVAMLVATSCAPSNNRCEDVCAPDRVGWLNSEYSYDGRFKELAAAEYQPLYGDVDKVAITTYKRESSSKRIDMEHPSQEVIYDFDHRGNVVKSVYYSDGKSAPDKTIIYKYDEEGRALERVEKQKMLDVEEGWITTYKYNSSGLLVESAVRYASYSEAGELWRYEYDSNGNRIHSTLFDGADLILWESFWKYDDGGRVVEISRHNYEDAAYAGVTRYKYGENGLLSQREYFWHDLDEATKITHSYAYDSNGNMIKDVEQSAGKDSYTTTYKYDERGCCIEQECRDKDGKFINKVCRKYDSCRNLVEEERYSDNEEYPVSVTKYNIIYSE